FSQKKISPLTVAQAADFLTALLLGVLIGGRVGYAVFYSPDLLTDFRSSFPFWGVLAVWEGGMASHGGFLGVWIACFYFSKKHKIPFPHLGDLTVVGAMIGIGLGRIANFINGELMGKVCNPDFPLAVKFPQDIYRWIGYAPEKLSRLKEAAMTLNVSPSDWNQSIDNVGAYKSKFYGLTDQIILQIQNGNQEVIQAVRPILETRHPSQLYASLTEGFIPLFITLMLWRKPRKPGLIGSLFIIIYSLGRIFNENFRLPDAHIANLAEQPLGISRGQFISLWMMLAGIVFLIWSQRRKAEKLGGWAS
ncbi:MAG: prolipoprotein diacylglyceryl transferase, partial [Bdellovibrionales bacterium]|nr:prolipoprotein diacylglyceryl transferase [Bdellovibrionales bacterium]